MGQEAFRDMVISKVPPDLSIGLSMALTNYYEVFMFLERFLYPKEPFEQIAEELDSMPINLLDKMTIQEQNKKHLLLCKAYGWEELGCKEDLLGRIFEPITIIITGIYDKNLSYSELAGATIMLTRIFADNASSKLKNDKSVDLTNVTRANANKLWKTL